MEVGGSDRKREAERKKRRKIGFRFKSVILNKMLGLPSGGPESEPFNTAL